MKIVARKNFLYSFLLIPVFVWIGFVCSISFMEAWIKFQAPNVSLSTGLGIGRLVFAALNKAEWCFAALIAGCIFLNRDRIKRKGLIFFFIPVFILALQTLYLLPLLNERADVLSLGIRAPSSFIHLYYIFFEAMKVLSLLIFGMKIVYDLTAGCKDRDDKV